jgi:type I restriction enzyme M protein
VDRTLNEWNEWQLKNLNAIVWLYRGETDKYEYLLVEYRNALLAYADTTEDKQLEKILRKSAKIAKILAELKEHRETLRAQAKTAVEAADKKNKKKTQEEWDARLAELDEIIGVAKEADWLYEKFGDGKYKDILGLCKIASRAEIAEKNYSLTPGAYVGVAPVEDDGVDFAERMTEIHQELLKLQDESNALMKTISKNMKEMGL